jgi:hypothetical protein
VLSRKDVKHCGLLVRFNSLISGLNLPKPRKCSKKSRVRGVAVVVGLVVGFVVESTALNWKEHFATLV